MLNVVDAYLKAHDQMHADTESATERAFKSYEEEIKSLKLENAELRRKVADLANRLIIIGAY